MIHMKVDFSEWLMVPREREGDATPPDDAHSTDTAQRLYPVLPTPTPFDDASAPPLEQLDLMLSTTGEVRLVSDLRQEAEESVPTISNACPLPAYLKEASRIFEQATANRIKGDAEHAYVQFVRFVLLVLERIPTHLEFQSTNEEYAALQLKCKRALWEAERLQAALQRQRSHC
eukprot:TRINITY_DN2822_c0_g1_i3.p1 TRINITY_DN2822_c0_g1~~TRINITY_DN2822_c0_g1_i3.p1  ORF type:complete len:174 (-),score=46.69 TRINITY_DN2822_c0_g1_i3:113-634(-)